MGRSRRAQSDKTFRRLRCRVLALKRNWVVCALSLLGELPTGDLTARTIQFVLDCRCRDGDFTGGFAPHPAHEANLLSTLSAVQILILLGQQNMFKPGGP